MSAAGASLPDRRRSFARVDLTAIRRNVSALRDHLPASVALGAVVKADGYGHGALAAASAALRGGASWLMVATVPEGIALRRGGFVGERILVLGPTAPAEVIDLVEANLTPIIGDSAAVGPIARAAARLGRAPYPLHVKVDTGLHRFGVAVNDALPFMRAHQAQPDIVVEGLATHFATADTIDDPFLLLQAERFARVVRALEECGLRPAIVHAANSGAALQRVACWDMVRIGIALYGIPPAPGFPLPPGIAPAMTVQSSVARVIDLGPGDSVGYGRTFIARAPCRGALVPLGYADGLARSLSNRGALLIGGRRCPVVGNISMDQCVVAIPDDLVIAVGDNVTVIGTQHGTSQTMSDLAGDADTIAYELAVRFGARLRREHVCDKPT